MNPDHDLRQLFRQQREADAQHVPAFSRLRRGSDIPVATRPAVWWRRAWATAAVVVLGAVFWPRAQPVVNTESWATLSNWQASTDELFTVSSTPWGATLRTPSDSLSETATATKETTL
jgi:hypothetical protein